MNIHLKKHWLTYITVVFSVSVLTLSVVMGNRIYKKYNEVVIAYPQENFTSHLLDAMLLANSSENGFLSKLSSIVRDVKNNENSEMVERSQKLEPCPPTATINGKKYKLDYNATSYKCEGTEVKN